MISKQQFYLQYNKNSKLNKNRLAGPIDAKLFLRDASLPLAYFLASKKVSANLVSIIFMITGLIANFLLPIPTLWALLASLILHEVSQLIDCVDGQLARYYGSSFKEGEALDTFITILITGTFIVAFSLRLYFETNNWVYLALGSFGAFFKAYEHQLIVDKKTLLDLSFFNKIITKSKFARYMFYGIESVLTEVRLSVAIIFVLYLLDKPLHSSFYEIFFLLIILAGLMENFILRFVLTYTALTTSKKVPWKGWT